MSPDALNFRPSNSTKPYSVRKSRTSITFEMPTPDLSAISLGVRAITSICAKTLVTTPN